MYIPPSLDPHAPPAPRTAPLKAMTAGVLPLPRPYHSVGEPGPHRGGAWPLRCGHPTVQGPSAAGERDTHIHPKGDTTGELAGQYNCPIGYYLIPFCEY